MEIFLQKIAKHLISTYADNLSEVCVVLPNKRAGLFLKQHLSKLINKPIWLPKIIGTEDLIEKLAETQIIDNTTLLFELYQVYQQTLKAPESFDEFSKWGQILLHDFNEIDNYLIPSDNFFNHINEARALEVWNLGEKEITEFQKQYLDFWKQLGKLYSDFNNHLKAKSYAYQGLAFRKVAEEIKTNPEKFINEKIKWNKIIFVGFNALNNAEETLITELKKQQKVEIFWDADDYYMNNNIQESGMFLRKLKKKEIFTPFNWISNKFNTNQKKINILGIPQNIGQAKYLPSILSGISKENAYKDTAIILADENMLIPVLQSLPNNISNINVTMGYPLKNTPLNNFFEIYFVTILNAERFGNKAKLNYHFKDLLKLFQLPFSQIIFGQENCMLITRHIIKQNWVFINNEKTDFINQHLAFPLSKKYDIKEVINTCLQFIEKGKIFYAKNVEEITNTQLELEYLFQYAKLFKQLKTLNHKYPFIKNIKCFYSIYRQLLSALSLDLYGEPLQGLQVMGMLETRNIDFKNIILFSTNEGILPAGKTYNSFIPFDIKKIYQLPTHIEKDAIYAYHFYRLIQHAENIHILYNTETNEFGSGEQSRFVTQLENELKNKNNISITKNIVTYPPFNNKPNPTSIKKTPEIIAKIIEHLEKGISPSAFNTFINCPLDYYYKYIIGIKQADEVEDLIDAASFGSYLHEVLELLYKEFVGKNITQQDLEMMIKKAPEVTHQVFLADFNDKELRKGKNLLTFNVARSYINTFLNVELSFIKNSSEELFINSLEKELKTTLSVEVNNKKYLINLIGTADRIDAIGNNLRIIDYKTGFVVPADLGIASAEDLLIPNKKNKAFQLLMYAFMYEKNNNIENTNLQSGIVSFRKLSNHFMPLKINKNKNINDNVLSDFEQILKQLVKDLLDKNQHFAHYSTAKYCNFCD